MATALTINSSPSSFQLRLGLQCRRGRTSSSSSSLIFSKTHLLSSSNAANHRRIVRLCAVSGGSLAAKEGEGKQRVSGGNSWRITAASGDAFAGWVDDETDSSNVSKQKQEDKKGGGGKGGIVAAAVAGVVLAAGLTFTSLYLSKKSSSAPKPDMEALTTQQEVLLSSDDLDDKDGQVGSEEITARKDEGFLHSDPESTTGINQDSSSPDTTEDTFESGPMDNITGGTSLIEKDDSESSHTDATNITSSQEDMQVKPGFSNMSVLPNSDLHLPRIFEPEIVNGHTNASSLTDIEADPDAVMPESSTEPKDNLVAVSLDNAPVSDDNSTNLDPDIQKEIAISKEVNNSDIPSDLSSSSGGQIPNESLALDNSVISESGAVPSLNVESEAVMEGEIPLSNKDDHDLSKMVQVPREVISSPLEGYNLNENAMSETTLTSVYSDSNINKPYTNTEIDGRNSYFEPLVPDSVSSAGIPAPSLVSVALQVPPGKVVVPAVVDQVQGHALAALQVLKVIEADVQPSDLCTRREYARWLVAASSALTRNSVSKVYPAMYIENVTELAFDDITTEDPDFASIQGLAEAGLISSKLSRNDMLQSSEKEQEPFLFFPESAVSRQDLVSWKMALEKRQLPEVDKKIVYQCCGFIDIDRINPDAWPALVADQSAGEQGIMALAFGYTRLFQPYKPVTKGQAAIALSTGEAAEIVSEELARIEAESMAETAVEAHTALVAQVEKDINASFEKELTMEREKIDAVEKMAQEAREELERLRAEREEENSSLMRGRAAVESEMQVLSSLRREVEEQLQSLMSDKMEISFERERISKLRGEAESENQAITRLQYELEVERKALAMARSWAEDEAKRAREQAKALEEARDRWEKHGIKVVVDDDLREDANAGVTWLSVGKESTVDATVSRAETLVSKLKTLAGEITGKSRLVIERIILKITSLISSLKEWAANSARKARELQGAAVSKASASVQELQNSATELSSSLKEGAKRVAEDCRDGVGKISQKFKA